MFNLHYDDNLTPEFVELMIKACRKRKAKVF